MDKYYDKLIALGLSYGPKLIGAFIVLIVGSFIIKFIVRSFEKVYNTFDQKGLNIPYPQMVIHVHND